MNEPFVISRVFDAPRDRVWKSWTEVERLKPQAKTFFSPRFGMVADRFGV